MTRHWTPVFGAQVDGGGAHVRVCAPAAARVQVGTDDGRTVSLARAEPGVFAGHVAGLGAGQRYTLRLDDHGPWPDPCSRWQPDGVHGPSMVVDPRRFAWSDSGWRGVPREQLVIYELHVGTFTPEGTFAAAAARLPALADLGVTAVELMPVGAFPGKRNWGYDGAAWFAPSEHYGHPDDLRALVDAAHRLGLAVLLDVVYNHLGPDGAYLPAFMPEFFSDRHHTPWGRAINLDGPGAEHVRRIICDNALSWLLEYRMDGLRLDATHALMDDSEEHLLAQLAREAAAHVPDRELHLIAEDERNLATLMLPRTSGGYGLTGVWADDFHHASRRLLAGDHEGWFADFEGSTQEIATTLGSGWLYSGQPTLREGRPRGTSPDQLPLESFVLCLQNHDQIGNRAYGDRLHHEVDRTRWLAANTLLLTAPETPMLFMGQEWAASAPFLYFTDHEPGLGAQVVAGRREEFARFSAFADPEVRDRIPDPQAAATFQASVLAWAEREVEPHAEVLADTRTLLSIRRAHLTGASRDRRTVAAFAPDAHVIVVAQPSSQGGVLLSVADVTGAGTRQVGFEGRLLGLLRDCTSSTADANAGTAGETRHGMAARVLYATDPAIAVPATLDLDGHDACLPIDARPEPFGLVVHLTGVRS